MLVLLRRIPLRYVVHYFAIIVIVIVINIVVVVIIIINFCIYAAVQYTL